MAVKIVWVVRENSDHTEGRGIMLNQCAFTWKQDAEAIVENERFMDVIPLTLYQATAEYYVSHKNKIRDQAIAKLTPEEREVLGL